MGVGRSWRNLARLGASPQSSRSVILCKAASKIITANVSRKAQKLSARGSPEAITHTENRKKANKPIILPGIIRDGNIRTLAEVDALSKAPN